MNCASACTVTIAANSSVTYGTDAVLDVIVLPGSSTVTLQMGGTDTLTWINGAVGGSTTTGSTNPRTLIVPSEFVAKKYATTAWYGKGIGAS